MLALVGLVLARDRAAGSSARDVLPDGRLSRRWRSALTVFVAPRTNRIYYDEQIYQSIGQNLSDLKLAQMCNDGTVEYGRLQCSDGRVQQAALRLSAPAEPGVSRVRRSRRRRRSSSTPCVMALTVCAVYLLALVAVSSDRVGGVLRRRCSWR